MNTATHTVQTDSLQHLRKFPVDMKRSFLQRSESANFLQIDCDWQVQYRFNKCIHLKVRAQPLSFHRPIEDTLMNSFCAQYKSDRDNKHNLWCVKQLAKHFCKIFYTLIGFIESVKTTKKKPHT